MSHTVNDALRMAGKLLLDSPTTTLLARDANGLYADPESSQACSFCYVGAIRAACHRLNILSTPAGKAALALTGIRWGIAWDNAGAEKQMEIARKLASVTEP